jgi:hypothetical protein
MTQVMPLYFSVPEVRLRLGWEGAQGLKPDHFGSHTARLKSYPDTKTGRVFADLRA